MAYIAGRRRQRRLLFFLLFFFYTLYASTYRFWIIDRSVGQCSSFLLDFLFLTRHDICFSAWPFPHLYRVFSLSFLFFSPHPSYIPPIFPPQFLLSSFSHFFPSFFSFLVRLSSSFLIFFFFFTSHLRPQFSDFVNWIVFAFIVRSLSARASGLYKYGSSWSCSILVIYTRYLFALVLESLRMFFLLRGSTYLSYKL